MEILRGKRARLFVSLTFSPSENLVTAVARLISDFCRMVMSSRDMAWRFYMAAQELAENITKFSTGSNVTLEVELEENDGEHVMRIYTRNETSPDRLEEVTRRLSEIKNAVDPTELYDRLVREAAPAQGVSGLGLVRIRAEGNLRIDYSVQGNELTICVHSPVVVREQ